MDPLLCTYCGRIASRADFETDVGYACECGMDESGIEELPLTAETIVTVLKNLLIDHGDEALEDELPASGGVPHLQSPSSVQGFLVWNILGKRFKVDVTEL